MRGNGEERGEPLERGGPGFVTSGLEDVTPVKEDALPASRPSPLPEDDLWVPEPLYSGY
jgi:hypothetical protein